MSIIALLQISSVTVCQILLKSVNVHRNYTNVKMWTFFVTQYIMRKIIQLPLTILTPINQCCTMKIVQN